MSGERGAAAAVVKFVELDAAELPRGLAGLRLTRVEAARRDRLVDAGDRLAYEAAHLLVRACAGELLGLDAAELLVKQRCDGCGGIGHGPPRVFVPRGDGEEALEVHVSLSHARGAVAAIAATERCGVDVERLGAAPGGAPGGVPGSVPGQRIPRGALTPEEAAWVEAQRDPFEAFLGLWTRKECLVKSGCAVLDEVRYLDVRVPPADVRFGDWRGSRALGAWCVVTRDPERRVTATG